MVSCVIHTFITNMEHKGYVPVSCNKIVVGSCWD